MTAAAFAPLAAPPCPECRGGGEINGVDCRACDGHGRVQKRARRSWRAIWRRMPVEAVSGAAATAAGMVTRSVPGVGGAAAVSAGLGGIAGHVFGHGLTPWVAATVAGVFGLLIDRAK